MELGTPSQVSTWLPGISVLEPPPALQLLPVRAGAASGGLPGQKAPWAVAEEGLREITSSKSAVVPPDAPLQGPHHMPSPVWNTSTHGGHM